MSRGKMPPTPLKITRQYSPFLALLCTTAGFFPGQFELVWYKNLSEITSGVNIRKMLNEEGLFHVSSELSLPEKGSVYTCQISHITLSVPANISDKIPNHVGRFHTINIFRLILGIGMVVLGTALLWII
ncbi:rano class II histocompatibility antigen, A beta chain-like [Hemiscyllium ocellatum]|uniref:rano class II histocompatibility antigen, A beta chain-like n=1 Tax=Hemiscyllium ocellatum TaxID=170820 RepID=UPI0029662518|nr:rano class II histocompatibility antigen, A beta chain-like [Hemiscyllium ocellatum]XP_060693839.1 rano class II histocompatibility antigen, A beta chain-like [Hemiscyllium ocellatum]